MNTVRIVHPEAGAAHVPESAVPHWIGRGWMPIEEPEPPAAPPARGEQQDDKPSKSRRRSSDEESE